MGNTSSSKTITLPTLSYENYDPLSAKISRDEATELFEKCEYDGPYTYYKQITDQLRTNEYIIYGENKDNKHEFLSSFGLIITVSESSSTQ